MINFIAAALAAALFPLSAFAQGAPDLRQALKSEKRPAPPTAQATAPEDIYGPEQRLWVEFEAANKYDRTLIAEAGVSIEQVDGPTVSGTADAGALKLLRSRGIKPVSAAPLSIVGTTNFPSNDAPYHDYAELTSALQGLASANPGAAKLFSIGRSWEGRDLWGLRLSVGEGRKPAALFLGTHHAREHLSTEIPLMLAQHLLNHKKDPEIRKLLETREIYIVPLVNPDGVEWDIRNDKYHMHRKNLRKNADGTIGVDLNRNYGWNFGGQGSSDRPGSDTYHGPSAFSEPESAAVKAFIEGHSNIRTLISYHTYSELVLYPWGHDYDPIANVRDRKTFETMAKTMAGWNGYKPMQSSDLYAASGDTTDWAYGARKIFAFTFELTPSSFWQGGFYPGVGVIQSTFDKNLKPALYLIELADDPYKVLDPA